MVHSRKRSSFRHGVVRCSDNEKVTGFKTDRGGVLRMIAFDIMMLSELVDCEESFRFLLVVVVATAHVFSRTCRSPPSLGSSSSRNLAGCKEDDVAQLQCRLTLPQRYLPIV